MLLAVAVSGLHLLFCLNFRSPGADQIEAPLISDGSDPLVGDLFRAVFDQACRAVEESNQSRTAVHFLNRIENPPNDVMSAGGRPSRKENSDLQGASSRLFFGQDVSMAMAC